MPLKSPKLDDRRFDDLVEEARQQIIQKCPDWTDLSPGDPGIVLLEVFSHLTEIMISRLNRLPEKAYIEFLGLIGVHLQPPSAAEATLEFTLSRPQDHPVEIAKGTRVTAGRAGSNSEPPVFSTADTVTIAPGDTKVNLRAYHCDLNEAELAGQATGLPGFSVTTKRKPVIGPTGDDLDLVVGVETDEDEIDGRDPAIQFNGKAYRIWQAAENFTQLGSNRYVYVADRLTGIIVFAPAVRLKGETGLLQETRQALAEIPAAGREIRLWYRCGGGPEGNVAANTLTTLKDPIPGLEVTNPTPAVGGRSAEELANALIRGPQELHSLRRAVTARDYELIAVRCSGAVNRSKAFTRAQLWAYAKSGTVEVLLVPNVTDFDESTGSISTELLKQHQLEKTRIQIQKALDERRPLGTECMVDWARYKQVRVKTRVLVHPEEDPSAVRTRVLQQLYRTINPLAIPPNSGGWTFGEPLKAWDVYKIIGSEPGVSSVDEMRLFVDEVPSNNVGALCADAFQKDTWYAVSGENVYRSLNNGDGWERIADFSGEELERISAFPLEASRNQRQAGLLAVVTRVGEKSSRLHFSRNCGETWETGPQFQVSATDIAWLDRDGVPTLLVATEDGLYEFKLRPKAVPEPILVDPKNHSLGFNAVAVSTDIGGSTSVAVVASGKQGVYLSSDSGNSKSFVNIGLDGELVRVLAVQHRGTYRYLWAGIAAPGKERGKGCFRWRLTGSAENPEGWRPYHSGWEAGGCRALAFQESTVFAASHRRGVLYLNVDIQNPKWESPDVNCGLPLRDIRHDGGRLQPVDTIACDVRNQIHLAGGVDGIFRSHGQGKPYECCSQSEFHDEVTLPKTWLFYSGEHEIDVVKEDETDRD